MNEGAQSLNSPQAQEHLGRRRVGTGGDSSWRFFWLGMVVIVLLSLLYGMLSVLNARMLDAREKLVEEFSARQRVLKNIRTHLTELEDSRRVIQQAKERGMVKTEERKVLPAREVGKK